MSGVPRFQSAVHDSGDIVDELFAIDSIMARIARAVAPGFPHHVTQRGGERRQQTFFNEEYYKAYLPLMSEWCLKYQVKI